MGIQTFPAVVGAVVPAYNIQGLARDLRFTPEVLAGIFLGRITKWNDPRIKEINRGRKPAGGGHRCGSSVRRQRHHLCVERVPFENEY